MINRILEISDTAAHLKIENRCLRVSVPEKPDVSIPLGEIGVLLMSNPAISLTQPVLAQLAAQGALVVVTGEKHLPHAMSLPLGVPATQAEVFMAQAQAPLPAQKRAWQQVIQAKLRGQAAVLRSLGQVDDFLQAMIPKVRSGDPDNVEARAARFYWQQLFEGHDFRREPEGEMPNNFLDYGYSVLRAIVARAVCASGLHPALGIHHHNRYDNYCLASDLMEPFRPLVDKTVRALMQSRHDELGEDLNREDRQTLLNAFSGRVLVEGARMTLFQGVSRLTASLADVYLKQRNDLILPEQLWDEAD
jgi:CRISPR-associated protein Cas1